MGWQTSYHRPTLLYILSSYLQALRNLHRHVVDYNLHSGDKGQLEKGASCTAWRHPEDVEVLATLAMGGKQIHYMGGGGLYRELGRGKSGVD